MDEIIPNPTAWIAEQQRRPPVIYVAHPVAPRPGEIVARCTSCKTEQAYIPSDAVDLNELCHCNAPVRSRDDPGEIVEFNLRRAMRWWQWFHLGIREAVWLMPWYVNVFANGEGDPHLIALGLRDDCAVVARCNALMLCGSRVSSGMAKEATAAVDAGVPVFQVVGADDEPNLLGPSTVYWRVWRP